jgi:hypothetical protein
LGFLGDSGSRFEPAFIGGLVPLNFREYVAPGETVRYGVEVVADNLFSNELHHFDVSWDGKWVDDDSQMFLHLTVVPAR